MSCVDEDMLTAVLYEDSWREDGAHGQTATQNLQVAAFLFCKAAGNKGLLGCTYLTCLHQECGRQNLETPVSFETTLSKRPYLFFPSWTDKSQSALQVGEEMGFHCMKKASLYHPGVSRNMPC